LRLRFERDLCDARALRRGGFDFAAFFFLRFFTGAFVTFRLCP
jgi:hypothetical protein